MKLLLTFIFAAILFFSCENKEDDKTCEGINYTIPQHILDEVNSEEGTVEIVVGVLNNGQIEYRMNSICCDFFNPAYNEDWEYLCSTGGITGNGDGLCQETSTITCESVLWKKFLED